MFLVIKFLNLVQGLTKINKLSLKVNKLKLGENYRKLLISCD